MAWDATAPTGPPQAGQGLWTASPPMAKPSGGAAPPHLPRWLLLRLLAYRLQVAALGDLDKATLRTLRLPKPGWRWEFGLPPVRDARADDTRRGRP